MTTFPAIDGLPQPFPPFRPPVTVAPSAAAPFEVSWREVRNYFSKLEVGDRSLWCIYEPPDWRLHNLTVQRMVGLIEVHGVEGLRMVSVDYEEETGWEPYEHETFIRVADDRAQWLGTLTGRTEGKRRLRTFLDEGFEEDWGSFCLHLRDTGRFEEIAPGQFRQRHGPGADDDLAGVVGPVELTVGAHTFTCLRVFEVPRQPTEHDLLFESLVTPEGRLLLGRRYNGRLWGHEHCQAFRDRGPWDQHLPDNHRLTVDGVEFTHWYDSLSSLAMG